MQFKLQVMLLLSSLLLLCGCMTTVRSIVPKDMEVKDLSSAGRVAGSFVVNPIWPRRFGRDEPFFGYFGLKIRRAGSSGEGATVSMDRPEAVKNAEDDIDDNGIVGWTFVLPLLPGKYEIYSFVFYSIAVTLTPKRDFSIPFEVKSGETIYLGQFHARSFWGKNLFGMPVAAGAYFDWSDERVRDVPLIEVRDPAVGSTQWRFDAFNPIGAGENFFKMPDSSSATAP